MELFFLTGFAAFAVLIFMLGIYLVHEAPRGFGEFIGMLFIAVSTSTFVTTMIKFAVDYYMYASATRTETLLKSLIGG
jgi:hypothetical protein